MADIVERAEKCAAWLKAYVDGDDGAGPRTLDEAYTEIAALLSEVANVFRQPAVFTVRDLSPEELDEIKAELLKPGEITVISQQKEEPEVYDADTLRKMLAEAGHIVPVVTNGTYEPPEHGWTCFHCGETFTKTHLARHHFGVDPKGLPACASPIAVPPEREGWQLVPKEPTEEMLRSGRVAIEEPAAPLVGLRRLGNAYRAMLSSAPEQKT